MSHFLEHLVFKGSKKRNAYQVLNRIESVGGDINAFTTREKTCFYVAVKNTYLERAVELLTDIIFSPANRDADIETEKLVIREEIEMYNDSPDDRIFNEFQKRIYGKHPLGNEILGSHTSLKSFNPDIINTFHKKHYVPENMILSVYGRISLVKLENIIRKNLLNIEAGLYKAQRIAPVSYKVFDLKRKEKFHQSHCIIGSKAYDIEYPQRWTLILLNDWLGGDWMSSKLNLAIREKYGFVYTIFSNYQTFTDSGLFSVYFSSDNKHLERVLGLLHKELKNLREKRFGSYQLQRIKRRLLGQLVMTHENRSLMMQVQAKNILDRNRILAKEEIREKIETVSANNILEVANEILNEKELSTIVFLNK
jgi:predicted Zn-dependent peptidase